MRQGNGSDLLGANDPRSATIGVIYVAPNDDRESVIAAILTQEKLGRKQIAIVLPQQNKAFQRPVDFDGLKNMRGKLQANLVIVAPHGSSPAEFARQRRFAYYTTLESYGKSLREENEASRASRGGLWRFGRRQQRLQPIPNDEPEDVEVIPVPLPPVQSAPAMPPQGRDDGAVDQEDTHPMAQAAPNEPAEIEDLPTNQLPQPLPDEEDHVLSFPLPQDAVDDDLELPAAPSPQVVDSSLAHSVAEPDEMVVPPPPLPASQPAPIADEDHSDDIITFPLPGRPRNSGTLPVPPPADDDELEDDDDIAVIPPPVPISRRNSGKTPIVAGATPPASAVSTPSTPGRRRTTVVLPPIVPPAASPTSPPRRRRRRSAWLLLLLLLLLFSCVFCGVMAVAAPSFIPIPIRSYVSNVVGGGSPGATVNITPKSAKELNTYVITGVTTGTADSAKRQVPARQLTYTTPATQKTVNSTGKVNIPATFATGSMTFYNGASTDYVVVAHTVFTDANGIQIANDSVVDIPAGGPQVGYGRITVSATAVTSGSAGNVRNLDFNYMPCCGSNAVYVSNGAFSGGQNAQHFTAVQQSDIDGAANPLKPQLQQGALTSLTAQKHANEQFVTPPTCTPAVKPDHVAGDRVSSFTVTVTATCNGYVYDQVAAQQLATDLLKKKASLDLQDPNYAQIGNVTASVTSATVDKKGTISMFVKAQGFWVYQFNDAIKKQLAKQIAGKKKKDARTFLQAQSEIGAVGKIDIPGNDDTVMPSDYTQIAIVVQNPPGVSGTGTAGSGPGAGTATAGRSSPGANSTSTPRP